MTSSQTLQMKWITKCGFGNKKVELFSRYHNIFLMTWYVIKELAKDDIWIVLGLNVLVWCL